MRRRDLLLLLSGAALAVPAAARAGPKKVPVIGIVARVGTIDTVFQQTLEESGFVDGRNVIIDRRYEHARHDQLPAAAADLVRRKVDLIVAHGPAEADAAKRATATIPIVFQSQDPVLEGLVASLARPGGNLTGVSLINSELMPKRLEFLTLLAPQAKAFALLLNPNAPEADAVIRNTQSAARTKGMELHVLKARNDGEIYAAFDTLGRLRTDGLLVDFDPTFNLYAGTVAALAAVEAVPAIYGWRGAVQVGGLISYGPRVATIHRLMGLYAGKILKGAKPADLPVMQVDRFELLINLKAAKALGLTVPRPLLALADEVIE